MARVIAWLVVALSTVGTVCGQGPAAAAPLQAETDEYTRYELLSPESASFAIRYEVTGGLAHPLSDSRPEAAPLLRFWQGGDHGRCREGAC